MIVVADTGPLHYLILLEHAELLHGLYGEVVVPDAVATELSSPSAPTAVRDWLSHAPAWFTERAQDGVAVLEPQRRNCVPNALGREPSRVSDPERNSVALRLC